MSGSQLPPPFCRLYPVPRPSSLTVPFPSAPNQVIHPTRFIIVNRGFSGPESAAPGRELPARGRDPLVRFRAAQRRFAGSAHRSPVPAAAFHLLPSVTSNSHSDSLSSETLSGWPCHAVHYNEPPRLRRESPVAGRDPSSASGRHCVSSAQSVDVLFGPWRSWRLSLRGPSVRLRATLRVD